jgi:DNA-binding transcriptional MerR regulator
MPQRHCFDWGPSARSCRRTRFRNEVAVVAWSTREIAELAGTTVRAVRHYHEVGLLDEPERRANGYKQYGVAHLIRVLRIKRLTDLGFSLPQIAAMGDADEHPAEALRTLDAELAATIERLQRVRVELGLILRQAAPTDLPPEFAPATARAELSDADRSFIVVMTRVLGPQGLRAYADFHHPQRPAQVIEQRRRRLLVDGRHRHGGTAHLVVGAAVLSHGRAALRGAGPGSARPRGRSRSGSRG